jgi:hypothetical protein
MAFSFRFRVVFDSFSPRLRLVNGLAVNRDCAHVSMLFSDRFRTACEAIGARIGAVCSAFASGFLLVFLRFLRGFARPKKGK